MSEARIEQLVGLFTKTWQRPPTPTELKGLIDDFVKEEISYREAIALGLDKDDTVVRRRLRQKLDFLASTDEALAPTDVELQAYLDAHVERYAREPLTTFLQVYFNPQRRPSTIEADVAETLARLRSEPSADARQLGDVTMLPGSVEQASSSAISREFGNSFVDALPKIEIGQWSGPVRSSFGLHLVQITARTPGRPARLDEVRNAVVRDLADDRRKEHEAERYRELLAKYEVTVASPPEAVITTPIEAK